MRWVRENLYKFKDEIVYLLYGVLVRVIEGIVNGILVYIFRFEY